MKLHGFTFNKSFYTKGWVGVPEISGVYIILTIVNGEKKIQYIGSSKNLRIRLVGHLKIKEIRKTMSELDRIEVAYCGLRFGYDILENSLILKYKPALNKIIPNLAGQDCRGLFKWFCENKFIN